MFTLIADNLCRKDFEDTPFMREGWVYVDGNDSEGRSIVVRVMQHTRTAYSCHSAATKASAQHVTTVL